MSRCAELSNDPTCGSDRNSSSTDSAPVDDEEEALDTARDGATDSPVNRPEGVRVSR
jgi:hypothetical protein